MGNKLFSNEGNPLYESALNNITIWLLPKSSHRLPIAESCMVLEGTVWHSFLPGAETAGHGPPQVLMVAGHEACLYNNVYISLHVSSLENILPVKVNGMTLMTIKNKMSLRVKHVYYDPQEKW